MADMSRDPNDNRVGHRWIGSFAVVIALTPVLYLISIGPALWLMKHKYLSGPTFGMIYHPLEWLSDDRWRWFTEPLAWYMELWV